MFKKLAAAALAATAVSACATQEDVRTMRRPPLPPGFVALASQGEKLHKGIAIYEINGAPEFKLFDEGDVYTTRPTRRQVRNYLNSWLLEADLLSEDVAHARYLLTVTFEELSGPDVVWFTDKRASAKVRYRIEHARTREVIFDRTFDSAFRARFPGVTEEMVRSAISQGLTGSAVGALANDMSNEQIAKIAAATIGLPAALDSAYFASQHDTLLWDEKDARRHLEGRLQDAGPRGIFWSSLGVRAMESSPGALSDFEAGYSIGAVGALSGFFGAAPQGRPPESSESPDTIGAFDGTRRRDEATRRMMLQHFNRFLIGLGEADLLRIRRAVPCSELNWDGNRGPAVLVSTRDVVGYDCPPSARSRRKSE